MFSALCCCCCCCWWIIHNTFERSPQHLCEIERALGAAAVSLKYLFSNSERESCNVKKVFRKLLMLKNEHSQLYRGKMCTRTKRAFANFIMGGWLIGGEKWCEYLRTKQRQWRWWQQTHKYITYHTCTL